MPLLLVAILSAQTPPKVTTPKEALGFNLGDDYQVASYAQLETYFALPLAISLSTSGFDSSLTRCA